MWSAAPSLRHDLGLLLPALLPRRVTLVLIVAAKEAAPAIERVQLAHVRLAEAPAVHGARILLGAQGRYGLGQRQRTALQRGGARQLV